MQTPRDIVRNIDGVISGYFSMSYAAPHLFGDQLDSFIGEVRQLLSERSPTGEFLGLAGRHRTRRRPTPARLSQLTLPLG